MIIFVSFSTFFSVCRALLGAFPVLQYLHLSLCEVSCAHFWVFFLMASNSLTSLILFNVLLWALYTSTQYAQVNTCSLVASSMSSNIVTSINISSVMLSSFSPPINYSLNILSYSMYLHSAILFIVCPSTPGKTHFFSFVIFSIAMKLLCNCGVA